MPPPTTRVELGTVEFVAMIAGLMALNALAIDIMLPALPDMGAEFGVADPNHRQYVVIVYVLGLGVAQLFFGPASDLLGRRRLLIGSLIGYALIGLGCVFAASFPMLLLARGFQGMAASGARVISISVVRDVHSGRAMARVMSLVMMVFMAVPILAPNLGKLVLLVAAWQWIFVVLVIAGLVMALWVALRLPETLPPDRRVPVRLGSLASVYGQVLKSRTSVGYMLSSGVIFGALFAFISSAEQVFTDVFDRGQAFTLYFALLAGGMAVTSFLNSRLVLRLGMRRLSHVSLVILTSVNLVYLALLHAGLDQFGLFLAAMMVSFGCFSLIGANFNALAMEPLGEIAGTASSVLGFASTFLAGTLGALVGQRFDGTVVPLATGFFLLGVSTLLILLVTERGRLFRDAQES